MGHMRLGNHEAVELWCRSLPCLFLEPGPPGQLMGASTVAQRGGSDLVVGLCRPRVSGVRRAEAR